MSNPSLPPCAKASFDQVCMEINPSGSAKLRFSSEGLEEETLTEDFLSRPRGRGAMVEALGTGAVAGVGVGMGRGYWGLRMWQ